MFGIFKNPKKVNEFTDKEITFFKEVIKLLPIRYHYIINQLNKNFLISFKPNDLSFKDWYSVQLNAKLEKEYSKPSLGYFQLQNILIFNKRTKIKEKLTLSFLEGMFIGFYIQDARFDNYILSEYDISGLKEKHFKNDGDKNDLLKIIGDINKEHLLQFDLENTFKIEIPEGNFYTIKDLEDGNYLALNEKGEVYELKHDPYSVKKVADSIVNFNI
ncbi:MULTISPECIES: hypothetical protein [unclassified Chryseobacterium]|uniref:hypothetical protein n=1 Tax=unclassified Chryseobacterium TaxID=2593645 RepID=UPI00301A8F37